MEVTEDTSLPAKQLAKFLEKSILDTVTEGATEGIPEIVRFFDICALGLDLDSLISIVMLDRFLVNIKWRSEKNITLPDHIIAYSLFQ